MGVLYPEEPKGVLSAVTANPILMRQFANQRVSNPRQNVTDLFGYGPDLSSYASNLSRNFAGQFEGLGTPQNFMGPFGFGGITAFHGSPYKFDKFDMKKLGTGEGAQAYGHGLYFAENPDVAKNYAPRDLNYENKLMGLYKKAESRGNYDAMEVLESAMLHRTPGELQTQYPNARDLIDEIAKLQSKAAFSLYKVDIPDEAVAKMLDWDAPLSQQPSTVKSLVESIQRIPDGEWAAMVKAAQEGGNDKFGLGISALAAIRRGDVKTGADLVNVVGNSLQGSAALRNHGIPGIKYLDQGSREGGKGTSNFVVFDDQIPKIIGRE
jgi:hypothetical protein